jgi:hypothetical protein
LTRFYRLGLDVDDAEEEIVVETKDEDAPPPLEGTSASAMEEID